MVTGIKLAATVPPKAETTMLPDEIEYWSNVLRRRREDLIAALRTRLHQGGGDDRTLAARLEPGDDAASADALAERGISLLAHEQEELKAIDAALARLRDGGFGLCQRCGVNIAAGRMHAQPSAAMCLACQEEQERHRSFGGRAIA